MEDTARAMAILGAATLLLAPLMNGILDEAAATADRLFLKHADWQGDPPVAPPDNFDPPDDLEEREMQGDANLTGELPGGAVPSCTIATEPVAGWLHADPSVDTEAAVINRTRDPSTMTFEVEDRHLGLGIQFRASDVTGTLSAAVYAEAGRMDPAWQIERNNVIQEELETRSQTRRPALTSGSWVAELNYQTATYTELEFIVVLASCSEAP